MPERVAEPEAREAEGLCATCRRARRITNDRGSVFVLCTYAATDPGYPKYPRLPVRACAAYMQE